MNLRKYERYKIKVEYRVELKRTAKKEKTVGEHTRMQKITKRKQESAENSKQKQERAENILKKRENKN